jgi:two-component system chemotaxis response regulator CheB
VIKKKIRVLVVDDSATVRQAMTQVLESDPEIEVIGTAADPYVAVRYMKDELPDVITLDIEMPRMDGLSFLDRIMSQHPIPVVICSTLTERGSESAMAALDRGAVDIITKPKLGTKQFIEESRIMLTEAVRAASKVDPRHLRARRSSPVQAKLTADAMLPKASSKAMLQTTDKVVAIGASTGGTDALLTLLRRMRVDSPGMLVVQHMPETFTAQFAKRLDSSCAISVKEAETGDTVLRGQALIAPGGKHMLLQRSGARYFVEVREGPLVSRHRPSVDVLFRSTARYAGKNAVGVILTGMGDDGARGMLEMKSAGAFNIAQDEHSCIVFGMPNEAIKLGGVDRVMPLDLIAEEVMRQAAA